MYDNDGNTDCKILQLSYDGVALNMAELFFSASLPGKGSLVNAQNNHVTGFTKPKYRKPTFDVFVNVRATRGNIFWEVVS